MIGGGLLGLEAANALHQLGLETHVVELAPRLMAVQVDDAGGRTLTRHIDKLGLTVHTGAMTEAVLGDEGRVHRLALEDRNPIDVDIVVFSAGIRPRDELARAAGLDVAERGGVLVDERCAPPTSTSGRSASARRVAGRMYGLVAPGYDDGRDRRRPRCSAATARSPAPTCPPSSSCSASTSRASATRSPTTEGALELVYADAVAGVYKKLVVSEDGKPCSAASWSATRRRTACCGRWSPVAASSCPTTRRT